jgi:hypothetical protein
LSLALALSINNKQQGQRKWGGVTQTTEERQRQAEQDNVTDQSAIQHSVRPREIGTGGTGGTSNHDNEDHQGSDTPDSVFCSLIFQSRYQ